MWDKPHFFSTQYQGNWVRGETALLMLINWVRAIIFLLPHIPSSKGIRGINFHKCYAMLHMKNEKINK
jgi:hypothetical protein